jgi:cysteine desulfurase family protein (TIGR01976 family)
MQNSIKQKKELDIHFVRNQFPSLKNNFIFMDNAGGSQTLGSVINRISDYLTNYNVQLGASYEVSETAGALLESVTKELAAFINAANPQEVIVGPSSTMLLRIISICLSRQWKSGDEIVVSNSDHEANVSCWMDLQEKGMVVKIWKINPDTLEFDLNDLNSLISSKTKLVALVHASNILGTINPIKEISKTVHNAGALFCVDGVAYAPHRLIDVQKFDVDFYAFSFYKVYGPHLAVLFGKYELLNKLDGINHYFLNDDVPYKFQPGNFNYELTYSLSGIIQYFRELYNHHFPDNPDLPDRDKFKRSFDLIADHEQTLAAYFLDYLKTKKDIKIIGSRNGDSLKRVPTISFIHERFRSSEVVKSIDKSRVGIRYGDFYAKKIIEDLGFVEKEGVIRVSIVHYNTMDEVKLLIAALEDIFTG